MAKQQQVLSGEDRHRALKTDPLISSFILHDVRPTGRLLGRGFYGTVEELQMGELVCAGKSLYKVFIATENQDVRRMAYKYYDVCSLLSALRHPNIVLFLGLCFLPASCLPVLVMERLQCSLDSVLENVTDIPLTIKVSVLQDVARGLAHMHNFRPSVIHMDLTARNVLLDAAMTAKIADLGNSRLADISLLQLAQTTAMEIQFIQEALVYMSPEVFGSNYRFSPPFDMFSFGSLALFVAIQVFPKDLLSHTYYDPVTKNLVFRTELEQREQYITMLCFKFDNAHPLVALIKNCLHNEPERRPTARQALEMLDMLRAAVYDPYSGLNRVELVKSLEQRDNESQEIPQLKYSLQQALVSVLNTKRREGEREGKEAI